MVQSHPDFIRAYFIEMWRSGARSKDGTKVDAYEAVRCLFNFGFRGIELNLLAR